MKNKSNFGAFILVSGLISLIFIAGAGYFVLPLIYPNINEEIETETETPNILLQSKYIDITTQAILYDDEMDFVKIIDTELSITTQGNSSLAVSFSMVVLMILDASFSGILFFEFAIAINGIGNRTIPFSYSRFSATGLEQHSVDFTINYLTGIIPSGTYNIEASWHSKSDPTGSSYLKSYFSPSMGPNYTRTIWAQELRG